MVTRSPSIKKEFLTNPYPENLILTLVRGRLNSIEVTPDIQAGLSFAISRLTDIEQEVLELRFNKHLSYKEIAGIRGRSNNSARNIEENAMRKLRRLPLIGYIIHGKDTFAKMEYVFYWPGETPPPKKEPPNPKILNISLDEMSLSDQAFNTLRSAGYKYVGDIANLSYEQILEIKFQPLKNRRGIAWKLRELGLRDTCWRFFE